MINIDDEDLDDETLEERIFEKADYIGEVLTGERKIKLYTPKPKKSQPKKPKKPSFIHKFIIDMRKSITKYREMSIARIIGITILLLTAIICITSIAYLLFMLLSKLLTFGILGLVFFAIIMCAISMSGMLLLSSRFTRK
jgi:hypothetical protein